jgi:DNA-binding GntR family transcriptional regulator
MELSPDDPRPAYLQIASTLREDIAAGKLKPGARLPSGRQLAKQFGTALMTVQHALRVLCDEGLVMPQQGRGVFVRSSEPSDVRASKEYLFPTSVVPQLEAIRDELRRMNDRLAHIERHLEGDYGLAGEHRKPTINDQAE